MTAALKSEAFQASPSIMALRGAKQAALAAEARAKAAEERFEDLARRTDEHVADLEARLRAAEERACRAEQHLVEEKNAFEQRLAEMQVSVQVARADAAEAIAMAERRMQEADIVAADKAAGAMRMVEARAKAAEDRLVRVCQAIKLALTSDGGRDLSGAA